MKRRVIALVCVLLVALVALLVLQLSSCSSAADDAPPIPSDNTNRTSPTSSAPAVDATPDVDLTQLSSTMVYGEVYNIMVSPEEYVGKTIKASGEFTYLTDEETGTVYYMLLIRDALACCAQGLEFYPTNGQQFPQDFPAYSTKIELTGTYTPYEENGTTYYYLVCDGFTILDE